jgi:hypothetical protein
LRQEIQLLDWHRCSLIAASSLVFAGVIALAVVFVPVALDRAEMVGADAPRGMPWARAETQQLPPAAEKTTALPPVSGRPLTNSELTNSEEAQRPLMHDERAESSESGSATKSAFAQQPESLTTEPPVTPSPAPVQEQSRAVQEEMQAAKPETIPRPSKMTIEPSVPARPKRSSAHASRPVAKPARAADDNAETRTREARRAVRRFDDKLRDLPLNAYANDGAPRMIVIHPTSIQDYYYYSSRR